MSEPKLTDLFGIGADGSWDADVPDEIRSGPYGPAVAAAVKVMDTGAHSYMLRGMLRAEDVLTILEAASPHLREQLAREVLERAARRVEGLIAAFEVPEEWAEAIDAFKDAAAVVRGEVTGR